MQLKNLKTNFLGRDAIYYKEIDSTQNEIWKLVENKSIKNGTLVIADIQTDGIGTHGRKWHTDEANNIAFSFFIQTDCDVKKLDGITIEIAKIIVGILKDKYGIDLHIKEPNDIIFNGKKIGGILTQSKIISENIKFLVIGIGINTSKTQFTEDIRDLATSIKREFDIEVDVQDFIAEFCNRFEKHILERIEK